MPSTRHQTAINRISNALSLSRALTAEGLLPNLDAHNSSVGAYGPYLYPGNARQYFLWNVGHNGYEGKGLYSFLIENGIGVDIGNNPGATAPGDVAC